MRAVTSFSEDGFERYGRNFLESYVKHWDVPLTVYIEGEIPAFTHPMVEYRKLFEVPGCEKFLRGLSAVPVFAGLLGDRRTYQLDAFTYTRKIFAQCHIAADTTADLLFWIDADTEFFGDVTEEWLESLFDEGSFMVYMDRPTFRHSCASFVGWDNSHPQADEFWKVYFQLVVSGQMFLLKEWHDSFLLDVVRKELKLEARDLARDMPMIEGEPTNIFDMVFVGKGRHYKGVNKFQPQRYNQLLDIVAEVRPKRILEVGTWNGVRALQMAAAAGRGVEYFGFDYFQSATSLTDAAEKNVKRHFTIEEVSKLLDDAGVKHFLYGGDSKMTLGKYLEEHGPGSADFIYIDGGHAVETIQSDWEFARKIIRPGGVVVFDDYYSGMSETDLDLWGANRVLEGVQNKEILPIADPVKGGGRVQMAVVRC